MQASESSVLDRQILAVFMYVYVCLQVNNGLWPGSGCQSVCYHQPVCVIGQQPGEFVMAKIGFATAHTSQTTSLRHTRMLPVKCGASPKCSRCLRVLLHTGLLGCMGGASWGWGRCILPFKLVLPHILCALCGPIQQ